MPGNAEIMKKLSKHSHSSLKSYASALKPLLIVAALIGITFYLLLTGGGNAKPKSEKSQPESSKPTAPTTFKAKIIAEFPHNHTGDVPFRSILTTLLLTLPRLWRLQLSHR